MSSIYIEYHARMGGGDVNTLSTPYVPVRPALPPSLRRSKVRLTLAAGLPRLSRLSLPASVLPALSLRLSAKRSPLTATISHDYCLRAERHHSHATQEHHTTHTRDDDCHATISASAAGQMFARVSQHNSAPAAE